jgi:hypothetical protein
MCGDTARMQIRNASKILVVKPTEKGPDTRCRCKLEDNIKMNPKETK